MTQATPKTRLEMMREKLREKEKRGSAGGDNASFPFWNMPDETSTTFRLLPDGNPSNDYCWAEGMTFKWTFPDPANPEKRVEIKMPCRETWDGPKTCPVMNELRQWYRSKDPEMEAEAKKYWPGRSFIYQGFVRKSELTETNPPENPIRILSFNKKIHKFIKDSFLNDDPETAFDVEPFDYKKGRNLIVKKTKDGKWADYTCNWANNSSALTDHETAIVGKHGLFDLSTRLAARPADEAFAVQEQMFQAGIDGKEWNPEWEKHFRPWRPDGHRPADDGHQGKDVKAPGDNETPPETRSDAPHPDTATVLAALRARSKGKQAAGA